VGTSLPLRNVTRLKTNIIASFAGQASANIIQLAITPVYIRSLGIEAYGLVGFQLALLTLSQVLDFGISPTVNRELARHSALSREAGEARDFVRTLEVGYWLIGCAIGLAVFGAAPYLSTHWLQRSSLSVATVEESIRIMAILIAAQWPLSFYQSGLLGLQRHRSLNVVRVATTAAAAIGGYIVVVRMPSVTAFFWWQTAMHLLHVGIVAGMLWHWLPGSVRRPRIRLAAIRHTGRFVAGMTVITITSLILTQLDRLVLSRLVSLEQFGYFAVAAILGYGVSAIARPIFMSIFPKFSALVASHDESAVDSLYRKSWQLMMIVVVPLAAVIAVFSGELLLVWTGNPLVAQAAGPIATILAIGSTVNGLMNIPFALQLAHGWTRLSARVNLLLVLVAVPGIVFAATRYGTLGASAIWPATNIVNMLVVIPVIHRRFLPGIGASWFLREVGGPVAVSVLIALLCRLALVGPNDRRWMVAAIVVAWLSAQMSLMLSSATLRQASKRWTVILANYARTRFSEARV
jgi:O-antigen/teichoic acid export membrane protein